MISWSTRPHIHKSIALWCKNALGNGGGVDARCGFGVTLVGGTINDMAAPAGPSDCAWWLQLGCVGARGSSSAMPGLATGISTSWVPVQFTPQPTSWDWGPSLVATCAGLINPVSVWL